MKQRGYALGTVLIVVALAMTAAFTMAGTCFFHLSTVTHTCNVQEARNLAESAIAESIDAILTTPTLGQNQKGRVTATLSPTDFGVVTFDPQDTLGVPYSVNNFWDDPNKGSTTGWNHLVVPQNCVALEATGLVGVDAQGHAKAQATVQCLVDFPPFPYSVASQGKVTSAGGLLIAGVQNASDFYDQSGNINYAKLLPSNMMSDSTDATAAISLGGSNRITGNLSAAGNVQVSQQTVVIGKTQPYASPIQIPDLTLSGYDPQSLGQPYQGMGSGFMNAPSLSGYYRQVGDVQITGGLNMNGAVVYVDGNLSVSGGIRGTGALIVTGSTTIVGGTQLSAGNMAAILSGGDVSLSGSGNAASTLQGLVYTKGNLNADGVTVLGAVVAGSGGQGNMVMNNVNMIHTPTAGQIDITSSSMTLPPMNFTSTGQTGTPAVLTASVQVAQNPSGTVSVTVSDGSQSYTTPSSTPATAYRQAGRWIVWDLLEKDGNNISFTPNNFPKFDAPNAFGYSISIMAPSVATTIQSQVQAPPPGTQTSNVSFSLDLDKFIRLEDRMRILIWREQ